MSTNTGWIREQPAKRYGYVPDQIRPIAGKDVTVFSTPQLGGFDLQGPNIYPFEHTQLYDPSNGGYIRFPTDATDAQFFGTANISESDNPIVMVGSALQKIMHPDTGVISEEVSISGSLRAIRWHFADPNRDGTGYWIAVPSDRIQNLIDASLDVYSYKTAIVCGRGGYGDYICQGYKDNEVIQEALNWVGARGGGTVLLKAGNYNIHVPPSVPANVRLKGEGFATCLFLNDQAGTNVLEFDTVSYSSVSDLRINGNRAGNPFDDYEGISVAGCSNILIERVWVHDTNRETVENSQTGTSGGSSSGNGIYITASSEVTVDKAEVYDLGGCGVKLTNNGGACTNCSVINTRAYRTGSDGILGWRVEYTMFANCHVFNTDEDGMTLHGQQTDATTGPKHSKIENCLVHDCAEDGVVCCVAADHCAISGCNSYGNGDDGFNLFRDGYYSSITDCRAEGNGQNGIRIQGVSDDTRGCNYNVVDGNTCTNNGFSNPGTFDGIRLEWSSSYNIVSNNICDGQSAGDQNVGIYLRHASCTKNLVDGNISLNNNTNYVDNGTSTTAANNIFA